MTPDICCRSLIQIELQIPRWRTKLRPCKGMVVSQTFIFHFKWYSLLHFSICQLLCWAFLFSKLAVLINATDLAFRMNSFLSGRKFQSALQWRSQGAGGGNPLEKREEYLRKKDNRDEERREWEWKGATCSSKIYVLGIFLFKACEVDTSRLFQPHLFILL